MVRAKSQNLNYILTLFRVFVGKILILLIRFYQYFISPLIGGNKCRFYPTCSTYAIEVIQKKGIIKGLFLAIWRILRCNPFSKGGDDLV